MDLIRLKGRYKIESTDILTGVKTVEYDNTICKALSAGLFKFFNYSFDVPSTDLLNTTYIAYGTGNSVATFNDSALSVEIFRKAITSRTYSSTVFTAKLSVGAAEGNPTGDYIKEVGVIAGGSDTLGTGNLLSRAVVNIQKNSNIKLLITWTLTVQNV